MTIALYISLALNYLFVATIVLVVTADESNVDWVQVALLWPVTVPMMWIRKLVRR